LRSIIRSAAVEASEGMSYGMPVFFLGGPAAYYAATRGHIGY
jgi:uncharacterized protein YdhG (YjbR/CyaY superfamily)